MEGGGGGEGWREEGLGRVRKVITFWPNKIAATSRCRVPVYPQALIHLAFNCLPGKSPPAPARAAFHELDVICTKAGRWCQNYDTRFG